MAIKNVLLQYSRRSEICVCKGVLAFSSQAVVYGHCLVTLLPWLQDHCSLLAALSMHALFKINGSTHRCPSLCRVILAVRVGVNRVWHGLGLSTSPTDWGRFSQWPKCPETTHALNTSNSNSGRVHSCYDEAFVSHERPGSLIQSQGSLRIYNS